MPAAAFNASDFKAFETKGFQPRMAVIRTRIRPKLEAIGHSLVPGVSRATGGNTPKASAVRKMTLRGWGPMLGIREPGMKSTG